MQKIQLIFYQDERGNIAFLIHKRYIPDPEQLNQQRFKCAAQMREPLYTGLPNIDKSLTRLYSV